MALETGTILNNIYRVVRLLGSGAMGNVYLVERIKDDVRFVVKELNFSKACGIDETTAKEIFFREAEFMVNFNHAGLPKTCGIFTEQGLDYLTMDYIEGKTLEEILTSSKKPLSEEKAVKWTGELCEILDYLHNSFKAPIVYRDLKPSNIIITPDDKLKLVDFGIARYYNPDKSTDTFSYGSPGYAAPEQYRGRGQSSPQSDVYGLGVILYQMLTLYDPSVKPFTFPSMKTLNPSVRPGMEDIIRRAIEMEPLKRYISVNDFRDSLLKYTGADKIASEKSGNSAWIRFYKTAGLFVISLCIVFYFFQPFQMFYNPEPSEIVIISVVIIILSSLVTFLLRHIIKLIIDMKNRKIKFSLLTRVMFFLSIAALVIVNIYTYKNQPYSISYYLMSSFFTIVWIFLLWLFIKAYIYTYSIINYSDTVRIMFIATVIVVYASLAFLTNPVTAVFLIIITLPFIWSLFHLIYLFCHRIIINPRKEPVQSFLLPASVIFMLYIVVFMILVPKFGKAQDSGHLAACDSNIKNLATALEMYGTDNKGVYPLKLDKLTEVTGTGGYMKIIPICPSSRKVPSYGYISASVPDNYTIWCTGVKAHIGAGIPGGYPQYAPGWGLILK